MKTRNILFLAATLGLNWQYASAAISISGVSGNITHKSTVTVSGSGFDALNNALPYWWNDFEHNSINPVASNSQQTTVNANDNMSIKSDGVWTGLRGSSYTAGGTFSGDATVESVSIRIDRTYYSKIYTYWKRRYDFDATANQKYWRMWAQGDADDFVAAYNSGGNVALAEQQDTGNPDRYQGSDYPKNKWLTQEARWSYTGGTGLYLDLSPAGGDGRFYFHENGIQLVGMESVHHTANNLLQLRTDNYCTAHPAAGSRVSMDDIYISSTWARVMISTTATLAASTIKAIQPMLTRSGSSISMVLNIAEFTETTLYLYVYNEDNSANANGFAITQGVGTTPLSPSASNVTSSAADETWTSFSTNYTKVLATDSGFTSIVSSATEGTASKSYSGLSASTQYFFQVKIATESDGAYASNQNNFTTSSSGGGVSSFSAGRGASGKWNFSGGSIRGQ